MIKGGSVLLLLSMFFAYLLAPAVDVVSRRVRVGRRGRPLSRGASLALIYAVLSVPIGLAWRFASEPISAWVHVTAPNTVEHLLGGGDFETIDRVIASAPLPASARPAIRRRVEGAIDYIQRHARTTLDTLIDAARYAAWLLVTPVLAALLLTIWPRFRRSTLRVLPRGHLQWRGEEYLHDVNSALAGYIRAQAAAGILVGLICVGGFVLLAVPSAVSLGVAAGVLELVPGIGPVTMLLIAVTQAGDSGLAVIAFLGALRVVQDTLVYPRLIRHGMHLSTPAVVLSLWAGAVFGGAGGVILALPVAGFLSVSLRHWREYRDIERLVRTSAKREP
ncbi:MAG: AI-2E family transporter [Vicinamibacterales bacterium]